MLILLKDPGLSLGTTVKIDPCLFLLSASMIAFSYSIIRSTDEAVEELDIESSLWRGGAIAPAKTSTSASTAVSSAISSEAAAA